MIFHGRNYDHRNKGHSKYFCCLILTLKSLAVTRVSFALILFMKGLENSVDSLNH